MITILTLVGCGKTTNTSKEEEKLLATDIEFSRKSVEVGAAEVFNLFLADDALQLPAEAEPIVGRENIYERMKPRSGSYVLRWEPKKAEVSASGDLGWTWGTYTLTTTDSAGTNKAFYGKYLNVWRKQPSGLWKVIIDIGNQNPASVP